MAKKVIGHGSITSLNQDDLDDGIVELVIELSDGTKVTQKWEFPSMAYRDGTQVGMGADELYYRFGEHVNDPEEVYRFIRLYCRQVDGPSLDRPQGDDKSYEANSSEESEGNGESSGEES